MPRRYTMVPSVTRSQEVWARFALLFEWYTLLLMARIERWADRPGPGDSRPLPDVSSFA
jgi:hypothetical protein